jgi:hypothetical protein
MLFVKQNVYEFLKLLTEKDRHIIGEHISRLEGEWPPTGDLERLYECRYRMHVGRKFTIFLEYDGANVTVLRVMTIQQAHKRYGRI